MARIRTIKPEFFTSDDICALSPLARLLYIGLWCEADREGRMVWTPSGFKRRYLPDDECDAAALCAELTGRGLVVLYGDGLAYIPTFSDHQHVNPREAVSKLPDPDACPTRAPRVTDASNLDLHAQGGREGKGTEGREGKDATRQPRPTDIAFAEFQTTAEQNGWPNPQFLNSTRRWSLDRRLSECGGIEGWRDALNAAAKAEFIKGQRWFDLDWMLKPENFTRLMEGRFEHKHQSAKPATGLTAALAGLD